MTLQRYRDGGLADAMAFAPHRWAELGRLAAIPVGCGPKPTFHHGARRAEPPAECRLSASHGPIGLADPKYSSQSSDFPQRWIRSVNLARVNAAYMQAAANRLSGARSVRQGAKSCSTPAFGAADDLALLDALPIAAADHRPCSVRSLSSPRPQRAVRETVRSSTCTALDWNAPIACDGRSPTSSPSFLAEHRCG